MMANFTDLIGGMLGTNKNWILENKFILAKIHLTENPYSHFTNHNQIRPEEC